MIADLLLLGMSLQWLSGLGGSSRAVPPPEFYAAPQPSVRTSVVTAVDRDIDVLLHDISQEKRTAAATRLGRSRDPGALNALITALQQDPSTDVRKAVADALTMIGSARALDALSQAAVNDPDDEVRKVAAANYAALAGAMQPQAPPAQPYDPDPHAAAAPYATSVPYTYYSSYPTYSYATWPFYSLAGFYNRYCNPYYWPYYDTYCYPYYLPTYYTYCRPWYLGGFSVIIDLGRHGHQSVVVHDRVRTHDRDHKSAGSRHEVRPGRPPAAGTMRGDHGAITGRGDLRGPNSVPPSASPTRIEGRTAPSVPRFSSFTGGAQDRIEDGRASRPSAVNGTRSATDLGRMTAPRSAGAPSPGFTTPRSAAEPRATSPPRTLGSPPGSTAPRSAGPSPGFTAPRSTVPSRSFTAPRNAGPAPSFSAPRSFNSSPSFGAPRGLGPAPGPSGPRTVAPSLSAGARQGLAAPRASGGPPGGGGRGGGRR